MQKSITTLQFLVCRKMPNAFSYSAQSDWLATFLDGECENVRAGNFRELSGKGVQCTFGISDKGTIL